MIRILRHPLFAPALILLALGWGSALTVFMIVGPALGGWAAAVLTYCFGWNAATRAYRLDAVLLVTLEPPLFALVVGVFYADEVRAFLRRLGGRVASGAAALGFVTAALVLVLSGEIVGGAPAPAGGLSVRDGRPAPRATLVDHRGRLFDLGAPLGRPVVLTFVYADCHASCPVLVATLKAAAARVGERATFVAVTLDREKDTPRALAAYARQWALDGDWHLLTGSRAAIDRVLADYGVPAARVAGGEIAHQNVIVVLDRAGRVAYTARGLGLAPDELARALERLAAERG